MPANDDPFDLGRFLTAQAPIIEQARAELRAGRKRTHWMWFVFPQAEGLGASAMSRTFAIRSPAEARANLDHPALGERLRLCMRLALAAERPLAEMFGPPDDLEFRSCATLFAAVAPQEPIFGGETDGAATAWLATRRDA